MSERNEHRNNCRVVMDGYGICHCHGPSVWVFALTRYELEDVTRMGEAWREMNLSIDGDWVKYDEAKDLFQKQETALGYLRADAKAYCITIKNLSNRISDLTTQLEAQSVTYQDNLTEIQFLKADLANKNKMLQAREKECDVLMAQRNLAEAKLERTR